MRGIDVVKYPYKYTSMSGASTAVSGDNYGVATICAMPYTTTIDKMAFYCNATTVAGDLTGRIETVTGSTNVPSGSLYHANATGTRAMGTADDAAWFEITFSAPFSITGGDHIAITCTRVSGTFTGSLWRIVTEADAFPTYAARAGAAWAVTNNRAAGVAIHSTTEGWVFIPGCPSMTDEVNYAFTPASSPDEVGAKITMPFRARAVAVDVWAGNVSATDVCTFRLYDSANTVLWSKAITFGTTVPSTSGVMRFPLPDRPILKKGSVYRLTMETQTGTLSTNYETFFPTSSASTGINNYVYTYRTDGGSWTDDPLRYPTHFGFILDQVGTNVPASALVR